MNKIELLAGANDEHDDDDNCDDGGDCKVSQPEKKQLQRVESELDIKILSDEDRKCRMEGFKNNYGGAFQSHSHIDRYLLAGCSCFVSLAHWQSQLNSSEQ